MRIRPLLPILLSTIAIPAVAADHTHCATASDFVACLIIEDAMQRQRDAEINAAIARVERISRHDLSTTHCKTPDSQTPRCLAERQRDFATRQNALAAASMALAAEVRARQAARAAESAAVMARARAEEARRLEIQQNALIEISLSSVAAERQRQFAARQNALANASISNVAAERQRQRMARLAPCTLANDDRAKCQMQRAREFAATQQALATASLQRVADERARAFAVARNNEINASLAAVAAARGQVPNNYVAAVGHPASICANSAAAGCQPIEAPQVALSDCRSVGYSAPGCRIDRANTTEVSYSLSHCKSASDTSPRCAAERAHQLQASLTHCKSATDASPRCEAERAHQLQASLTHCKSATDASPRCEAERARDFRIARNNEIDRSIAAVAAARARGLLDTAATTQPHSNSIETGAISVPQLPKTPAVEMERRGSRFHDISNDPCRVGLFDPVPFTRSGRIESEARPELDRLARLVETCPGMRVEVHGYTDGGSRANNTHLSQQRARAVADYLIASGVAPNRIAAIGRGGRQPVLPYSKEYEDPLGSRAELIVRDPSMDAAARRVMWDLAEVLDPTYIPAVANLSP
ncbi:OmpA family protein [Hyphomicrobium sp. NDB2Meth4]|uniref:OmpA family protein n=1 Tax=Hyphomicrobium sp. NDB2Meth4 TaxID=1892846 RepID=UPI0009F85183|nr:OmpA family protein [Hyphomicrobium sp. NDB2Meth4]